MAETGELVKRKYTGFRGVDFRGEDNNLARSPDALNVWRDYKETESIRTRPGAKLLQAFNAKVYGVFFFRGVMLVHSGTKLYRVQNGSQSVIFDGCNEAVSDSFVYENVWYFKDGKNYLRYDGETIKDVSEFAYVPTTSIGRKPNAGGTTHEDVNMLTSRRKNTFLADGDGRVFLLDARDIDTDFKPIVTVDGIEWLEHTEYEVDYKNGKITMSNPPDAPGTDGQDNVVIEFSKTTDGHADRIKKCTLLQVFDNRVFFSGNPDFPNVLWHCSLNDPAYCSDLDYYEEGLDESPIRGIVAGNNALWVFREQSDANTTVFYHNPVTDEQYGKIYPSQHSSVTTGCIGRAVNFNDDIVFFSERGMEGISGDITTEQAVAHRSALVDRKLLSEADYKDMILAEWEGYLLVIIGDKIYLADSRRTFTNEDHYEYEWFFWSLGRKITCARVFSGLLYLGCEDGVYTLNDSAASIESYWTTPKDRFAAPQMLKTTNKRGCIAEATGDINVLAKVEDTDFEPIGSYKGVTDYFVSRIKRKKWKDIQLKFHSDTRFSLEAVTLEAFVGGYIKR